ncbi:MAG: NAD(P)-binding domain-containing protein [Deinococcales bacterium]
MPKIAMLGLGEAGSAFARDLLKQGVQVNAWDPAPKHLPAGINFAQSNAEAARGADIILSANLAAVALDIAHELLPALSPEQLFAEMNTASPKLKQDIAELLRPTGARVIDVAIMAPVPLKGLGTPMLVSGEGAKDFAKLMRPLGMPVSVVEGEVGLAAQHKLLRSIAYKGIAAVIIECLEAAKKFDKEAYAREQITSLIGDETMIDRFVEGSYQHALRRKHEMEAVKAMLAEVGVSAFSTEASILRLDELLKG